jgi:hypothetical protein
VGSTCRERREGGKLVGWWAAKQLGRSGGDGPGERGRYRAAAANGPEERAGLRAGREGVRDLGGFVFNFKFFSKCKHFKPFASFQIILKTFKTSHPHT